ncbi:MAG: MlaD family protein [Propionivibrio sp.]
MENRSHALIAGLFTLLLGLAVVSSVLWFGGKPEATRDYLVVTTKNITGLSLQAQVRYRGIRVGKVESIELDPQDVSRTLIRISILDEIPVTKSTTAQLGFQGVTGIAHILLEENGDNHEPLEAGKDGLPQIAMQDSLIETLSDAGGETLRSAREFLDSVNQLLGPDNRQKFSSILANLDATTGQMHTASAQLNQLLSPQNVRLLHSTLVQAERSVGQVAPLLSDARGLIVRLQGVSKQLDSSLGELASAGTTTLNALGELRSLGTLTPKLSELSADLAGSSRQLNRVLRMLEESPQSLLFGRRAPAPGPGEAGFQVPVEASRQP